MKIKSLKIDKACQEVWDSMLTDNDGRFCELCEKSVIDFTGLSQKETFKILKKSKGGICGRITHSQIKTPFLDITEPTKYRLPHSKAVASIMLLASLSSIQSCDSKDSKVKYDSSMHKKPSNSSVAIRNNSPEIVTKKETIKFSGKVTTLEGLVLDNVRITLVTIGKLYTTYSKIDGSFSIEIPKDVINDNNVVRFDYSDLKKINGHFDYQNVVLSRLELSSFYKNIAYQSDLIMGEMIVDTQVEEKLTKSNPVIIIDGVDVDFEEFDKAIKGKKSTCNITNKGYMHFEREAAVALYGEKAKYGLFMFSKAIKEH